jgi:hypothetical protein
MDKYRFASKDAFISSLRQVPCVRLKSGNQIYDDTNDVDILDITQFLNQNSIFPLVQAFTNIGIDNEFIIWIKFKVFRCTYQANMKMFVTFPTSISISSLLKKLLFCASEKIGVERYNEWCMKYDNIKITSGRKRLAVGNGCINWLLKENEEPEMLKNLECDFDQNSHTLITRILNTFSKDESGTAYTSIWEAPPIASTSFTYNEEHKKDLIYTVSETATDPIFLQRLNTLNKVQFNDIHSWIDNLQKLSL